MEYLKLNNGVMMPQIGYGVYQIAPDVCECHVAEALNVGLTVESVATRFSSLPKCGFPTTAMTRRKLP